MEQAARISELKNPNLVLKKKILEFYNAGFPKSQWDMEKLDYFFCEKNKGICLVVEKENEIGGMIIGRKNKVTKNCVTLSALLVGDD
ncbi:MAG: hypothetical protein PHW24_02635, partial [Candidatus Moranbacteria bacterium]|nr:hypothetical protein [Candidatus Moranbacteria bacterium]